MKKTTSIRAFNAIFMAFLFFTVFIAQCTKPTTIGGEFVEGDQANFEYVDTFKLNIKTEKSTDSLKRTVLSPTALQKYFLGHLDDPIFGENTADIFAPFLPPTNVKVSELEGATVDSVVMILVLDSAGFYGQADAMQSLEVSRVVEPLRLDTNYYVFQDFEVDPILVGEKNNFVPNLSKRIYVAKLDSSVIDSNLVYLRIPLDNSLAEEVLAYDSTDFATSKNFAEKFRGLKIASTMVSGGMMSVKLNVLHSGIKIYYQTPGEDSLQMSLFPLGYAASERYTKDYAGSVVEQHIDVMNDSMFFLQSTAGLNLEVELPNLASEGDVIINKAILEFTLGDLMVDDTTLYRINKQLTLRDTSDVLVEDLRQLASGGGATLAYAYGHFGGRPKLVTRNGETRMVVQMNISTLMQDVQRGNVSQKIRLKPTPEVTVLGRMVIQGFSGAKEWQPRLMLNFTKLN